MTARVAAIIPAYDAERTVFAVASQTVQLWGDRGSVYVVDDGSRDNTRQEAERAGATLLVHPHNQGKGVALRSGFSRALADGHSMAVTLDADGQHPPQEAVRLADLPANDRALVLGIRDLRGANAPRPNQISNAISNGFLSLFARTMLRDTQCGLRRYPLPEALRWGGSDRGYAFEAEMILLAVAAHAPIVEEPIEVRYPEDRTTHFDSVRDPMRVIRRVLHTLVRTRGVTRTLVNSSQGSESAVRPAPRHEGPGGSAA